MNQLDKIRGQAQTALIVFIAASAALYPLLALLFAPEKLIPGTLLLAGVAAAAIASWKMSPNTATSRNTVGAAVIAFPAALVYMMSGAAWQIDMHMVFFASLAITAVMIDWRVIVTASAVTAVHHLSLNFLLPWAVFPEGSDFLRVLFHAVVVVGQATALIWMTWQTAKAFLEAQQNYDEAMAAQAEVNSASEAQKTLQAETEARSKAIADLSAAFEQELRLIASGISGASAQIDGLAQQLTSDADETRSGAESATQHATQTNSDVQSVAAAAQELSASITEVARILEGTGEVSERAAAEAQGAGRSIDELETAAREIEDIMRLVADVAEQTNLLALNATIEAARAGEAGKGFAVVASEVKALAEQTSSASNDIAQKIEAMRGASGGAATSLGRITEIIAELRESTESVQGAFDQQSGATREIAQLAEKAASATADVNASMENVSLAAGRTTEAATEFTGASGELGHSATKLDEELNRFKAALDAA